MEEDSFLGLCKRVSVVQYPRGKLVLKQGRAVDEFMYLLKGNTGLTLTLILTLTAVSLGGSMMAVDENELKKKNEPAGDRFFGGLDMDEETT